MLNTNEHITTTNKMTAVRKTAYLVFSELNKLKHFYDNKLDRTFKSFDDKQLQEQTNDEEYNH